MSANCNCELNGTNSTRSMLSWTRFSRAWAVPTNKGLALRVNSMVKPALDLVLAGGPYVQRKAGLFRRAAQLRQVEDEGAQVRRSGPGNPRISVGVIHGVCTNRSPLCHVPKSFVSLHDLSFPFS